MAHLGTEIDNKQINNYIGMTTGHQTKLKTFRMRK
jgi:hypothetical protein